MVSDCTNSGFRLCMHRVMLCLQSQQYIVQQELFKNGRT